MGPGLHIIRGFLPFVKNLPQETRVLLKTGGMEMSEFKLNPPCERLHGRLPKVGIRPIIDGRRRRHSGIS